MTVLVEVARSIRSVVGDSFGGLDAKHTRL